MNLIILLAKVRHYGKINQFHQAAEGRDWYREANARNRNGKDLRAALDELKANGIEISHWEYSIV